uniref:ubiquitinyl hydrolase 1 n=1 Tax=Strigamia maritima TaxID=126957 RepID=T1JKM8_STRMM
QDGSLCAQHCLNALLQGEYFTAVDLATLAQQMDEAERLRMAEAGINSQEYRQFLEQPSINMDDSGYFSIQVIASALKVWNLELIPYNSRNPLALAANVNPVHQMAFICNYRDHWFTVRKLGRQWFNLNSLLTGPELISDTYLAMFLAQLQQEGYSIFIVQGLFPECEADNFLRLKLAVQAIKPRLIAEVKAQQEAKINGKDKNSLEDEDAELDAALRLSLQEYNSNLPSSSNDDPDDTNEYTELCCKQTQTSLEDVTSLNTDPPSPTNSKATASKTTVTSISDDFSEEAMLEAALKMSMEQETG